LIVQPVLEPEADREAELPRMLEVLGALRLTEVGSLAVVDALDWSVREPG
jgi:hypothetical protein